VSITTLKTPAITVVDEQVLIDGFAEGDPGVVATVRAAPDASEAVHQLLHLGSRLAALATGSGSLSELESRTGARLEALTDSATQVVSSGLNAFRESAAKLFGAEDSEMAGALASFLAEFDRHLGDAFDPHDKRSLIALLERSIVGLLDSFSRRWAENTDPDVPGSPAARLLGQVRASNDEIKSEVTALALAVGAVQGRADENQRTAVKGIEFETLVLTALEAIAAPLGDTVAHVGTTTGSKGTKKGDMVVTLGEDEHGTGGRYVVEAKAKALTVGATWRELDAAMANWEAAAAIAVFASGDQAPTKLPFWHAGERAIVVLDRTDPDPAALALACLFARWVVRRRSAHAGDLPDLDRIGAGIERASRALGRMSAIRRYLSTNAKSNADTRAQVEEMAAEVRDALAELAAEVGR